MGGAKSGRRRRLHASTRRRDPALRATIPEEAAKHISTSSRWIRPYARTDKKVNYDLYLDQSSIDHLKPSKPSFEEGGKLAKPIDWEKFIYADVMKKVQPDRVNFVLPK